MTVERVLIAAATVLDLKGFDGFSMQSVADESGLAIGTLYQYFPNKYAILEVLVSRWYAKSRLFDKDPTSLVPNVEAQAEVYFNEVGATALLEAIQVVPELRAYDRLTNELSVDRVAQRLRGDEELTPTHTAMAQVSVFAIDAVLRQATVLPREEAMEVVAVLKQWVEALYTGINPES
jgi:AcrR family transcriptional regulator